MNQQKRSHAAAVLAVLLLVTALTGCKIAPASQPASPASISSSPESALEIPMEPLLTPEEPSQVPLEYRPPVEGVAGDKGDCQADIWEWDFHYPVSAGTPVLCPLPGEIAEIAEGSVWPYGKYLLIQVTEDIQLRICHLQEVNAALKIGDRVEQADQIGLAGRTGNVTDYVVGVTLSRQNEAGEYQALAVNQWDFLLAEAADSETLPEYTPPVRGKTTENLLLPMSSVELIYRTGSTGVPVYSPVEGTIEQIQSEVVWPFGRWVTIRTENDLQVLVTHLSEVEPTLQIGDVVNSETQIGLSGVSGSASQPVTGVVVEKQDRSGEYGPVAIGLWDTIFTNWSEKEFAR